MRDLPPTNDYHNGGAIVYVEKYGSFPNQGTVIGGNIIIIGGTSTDAGRIEAYDEDTEAWHTVPQEDFDLIATFYYDS